MKYTSISCTRYDYKRKPCRRQAHFPQSASHYDSHTALSFYNIRYYTFSRKSISAYFEDDCADELTLDPVFNAILEKKSLASQPTLSRFFNRMNEDTLIQFDDIDKSLRDIIRYCAMTD